jgi:hypothetical protein
MTHDWFSHLEEGHNDLQPAKISMGCETHLVNGINKELTAQEVQELECRPKDRVDPAFLADRDEPRTFNQNGKPYLARAPKTSRNNVTAWWDASQIYGYDENSRKRVKRDPKDPAKLQLRDGYLPEFETGDPINPAWKGQEATAFPDNWSIGLSFYHNVFAREHNQFVEAFRRKAAATPDDDSGLRNPADPGKVIPYRAVTADELFEIVRLVVAAEIAKIHTTEWTTQLLYDEPLYKGMNANWHGLFSDDSLAAGALQDAVSTARKSDDPMKANQLYSAFAGGPGIVGLGNEVPDCWLWIFFCNDRWNLANRGHVNGGTNHFGSPFNFPEEFITVYRLHPLVPDLIEYRDAAKNADVIAAKVPVIDTFRGKATEAMHQGGLASWGLSMGRQRLGLLTLQNHPQFLQNLPMPRLQTKTNQIDVAALDLIRDRERGVPRFNEFRRQYGLRQLTSFDDFIDTRLDEKNPAQKVELDRQRELVKTLREVYGTHVCDRTKQITRAQVNDDEARSPITDCLGHEIGQPQDKKIVVDNIEDLDTVVGWLAEFPRPHGFAISETQFQVFILNASRRLFSDRFFTSSFRKEFYSNLGIEWVTNNGPDGKKMETQESNGHKVEVSPLKRVLQRTIPELKPGLDHVVNVFDPWARDRGEYYSLQWKARVGAENDQAFSPVIHTGARQ